MRMKHAAVVAGLALGLISKVAVAAPVSFEYTGGFQSYTVNQSGVYSFIVYGANGGTDNTNGVNRGGLGGQLDAQFNLSAGTVLSIAVGGNGGYGTLGGGGGGSFVAFTEPNLTPLIIAGGGGGAGVYDLGGDARAEQAGAAGTGTNTADGSIAGAGGEAGSGGFAGLSNGQLRSGAGGGGFLTNGQSSLGGGGQSFLNGLEGGHGSQGTQPGGFGGGGGSAGGADIGGGGGGGGYSGGGGGVTSETTYYGAGGGGGSYLDFALLVQGSNSFGLSDRIDGNGFVQLDLVSASVSPVPLPASAPMFGAALLGLAGIGYGLKRKKAAAAA